MKHTGRVLGVLLVVMIVAGITVTTGLAASNATSVFIGDAKINISGSGSSFIWTSSCYLTYSANTSSYIDITEMRQRISNKGARYVMSTEFTAASGNEANSFTISNFDDGIPDHGIATGKTATVTADWDYLCDINGKSNRYQKNGGSQCAFTRMISSSEDVMSTWANTYWLASTRETDLSK